MAPNKFASMLNRKTNRITLVLVYALLEWALILSLLLNSLFSYLIFKFADYFGLKPPCLVCSRIDHLFESQHCNSSYRDLICDHHAFELSRSGYSAVAEDRRKVIGSEVSGDEIGRSRDIQIGPQSELVKEDDQSLERFSFLRSEEGYCLVEEGDLVLEGENEPLLEDSYVEEKIIPDQHLEFYIDLDDYQLIPVELACSEMERWKVEGRVDELWRVTDEELVVEPDIRVAPAAFDAAEKLKSSSFDSLELYETKIADLPAKQGEEERDDDLGEIKTMDSPCEEVREEECEVEISSDIEGEAESAIKYVDYHVAGDLQGYVPLSTSDLDDIYYKESDDIYIVSDVESLDGSQVTEPPTPGKDECPSTNDVICEVSTSSSSAVELSDSILTSDIEDACKRDNHEHDIVRNAESIRHCKDECPLTNDLIYEASASSEPKQTQKTQNHNDMTVEIAEPELRSDAAVSHEANEVNGDRIPNTRNSPHSLQALQIPLLWNIGSSSVETLDSRTGHELDWGEEDTCEASPIDDLCVASTYDVASEASPIDDICVASTNDVTCEASTSSRDLLEKGDYEPKQIEETQKHMNMIIELQSDAEGDRVPDTPDSACSLHHYLHNEIPGLASTETLDVITGDELDVGEEEATTFTELKSLLESERKALRALYAELDEERNAAAIATNQTMAMINRLQEEKATIEMEALQYQRMMEEQSEFDQETLQLLNEMLIKREKELREVEKELESCRKRVMDYEERERMRLLSQRKDRISCSNGEESDDVSVDLNNEAREEDSDYKCEVNGHLHNTPVDAVLDLQDSFCSFEEERISILEQLKVLEEKLCSLSEEEEQHIENMKPFEQFYEENATEFDAAKINGNHHQERRMNGSKPKQLLPLFDAAEIESDGELSNGVEDGLDHLVAHTPLPTRYELERKRFTIEEEVDHVYERLHALEADREFVKHCVGSLMKGDKGVHLLQEILQHLRDLKNVELEARNVSGSC